MFPEGISSLHQVSVKCYSIYGGKCQNKGQENNVNHILNKVKIMRAEARKLR